MSTSIKSTTPKLLFLDANVLLEILLQRKQAGRARKYLADHVQDELCISTLTAHIVVYFGLQTVDQAVIRQFLAGYTLLSLEAADFEWAFNNSKNDDFEDALQVAVAHRHRCVEFRTFDKKLHTAYKNNPQLSVKLV